jgi:transcription-repair coupling factor (superfamily II helicase)
MKLLEETIRELKGEDLEDDRRAVVNLRLDLRIEDSYIPDMNQRLSAYRRMASARSLEEVGTFLEELRDRYGAPPASILNLAQYARIRVVADRIGVESLDREGSAVVMKFRGDAKLDPAMILRLVQSRPDLTLLPPAVIRMDLKASGVFSSRKRLEKTPDVLAPVSWWTARATSEVAPGFTRQAILAETPTDPAAPGGLFERLGQVLDQLSQSLVAS